MVPERGQVAVAYVCEKLRHCPEVVERPECAQWIEVGGRLHLALHVLHQSWEYRGKDRTGDSKEVDAARLKHSFEVDLTQRDVVIVPPGDSVSAQEVEDGPGFGIVHHPHGDVVDESVGGTSYQETTVGEGWSQARTEPSRRERECARQAVVEGQVRFRPVRHGGSGVHAGQSLLNAAHESIACAIVELNVRRRPGLGGHTRLLSRSFEVREGHLSTKGVSVRSRWMSCGVQCQSVAALGQHT